MKEFKVANLMGAHCTGIEAVYHIRERLGLPRASAVVGSVGASFVLGEGIHPGPLEMTVRPCTSRELGNGRKDCERKCNSAVGGRTATTSVQTRIGCIAGIGRELRRKGIDIEQPDPAVVVVIEKGFEIPARNLARPNDFRGVDLGGVIHPLVGHVMVWSIANYNEMFLGRGLQLPGDLRAR